MELSVLLLLLVAIPSLTALTVSQFEADMLREHNYKRVKVPAKMEHLVWNSTIATYAQLRAKTCTGSGSQWTEEAANENLGQNRFVARLTSAQINEVVFIATKTWYNEGENYNLEDGSCKKPDGKTAYCNKYKQMMWARTTQLGCGYHECTKTFPKKYYVVCGYSEPKNNDEAPYIEEKKCIP